jgi:hypothetical protein
VGCLGVVVLESQVGGGEGAAGDRVGELGEEVGQGNGLSTQLEEPLVIPGDGAFGHRAGRGVAGAGGAEMEVVEVEDAGADRGQLPVEHARRAGGVDQPVAALVVAVEERRPGGRGERRTRRERGDERLDRRCDLPGLRIAGGAVDELEKGIEAGGAQRVRALTLSLSQRDKGPERSGVDAGQAAVDETDRLGVVDVDRAGVGDLLEQQPALAGGEEGRRAVDLWVEDVAVELVLDVGAPEATELEDAVKLGALLSETDAFDGTAE